MATRTLHNEPGETWFITFTCYNWIPLFEITQSYNLLYDWLKFISKRYNIETHAFVFMPNHIHIIIKLPEIQAELNKVISNGKRFLAYELVKKLKILGKIDLLEQLSAACTEKEKAKGQKHKIFELSFDAKPSQRRFSIKKQITYITIRCLVNGRCVAISPCMLIAARLFIIYQNLTNILTLLITGIFGPMFIK